MYIQLAWRNIWRNTRRTSVILAAVIIGVWSMIFLGALMRGMMDDMVENGKAILTGDVQIHHKAYRADPSVENSMPDKAALSAAFRQLLPDGSVWASRIRVSAIASTARHSSGVTLVGIEPEKEKNLSFIGTSVYEGRYLSEDDRGILIGKALLDKFKAKVGQKIVLMAQDTQRNIASRAFRIAGVYRSTMQATEKQFVFVTLTEADAMLSLSGGISEVSLLLPDAGMAEPVTGILKNELNGNDYAVHTWRDLLPMLSAYLKIFDGFMYIWFLVTFVAMGFGIVNTTLMAVFERMREFGILRALGMKPWQVIRGVLLESFFILLVGMAVGDVLAFLGIYALSGTGLDLSALAAGAEFVGMSRVIYPVLDIRDVVTANLMVLVPGLLVSLYPARKAAGFLPVEAMAHN